MGDFCYMHIHLYKVEPIQVPVKLVKLSCRHHDRFFCAPFLQQAYNKRLTLLTINNERCELVPQYLNSFLPILLFAIIAV